MIYTNFFAIAHYAVFLADKGLQQVMVSFGLRQWENHGCSRTYSVKGSLNITSSTYC